jgi:hypothetical protein
LIDATDERLLARVGRRQRAAILTGLALVALGGLYALWGIGRFDPRTDPRAEPGFDRPIAELAFLFDRKDRALGNIEPGTSMERFLVRELRYQIQLTTSLIILLLRLFVGTLVLTAGLILLTVVVERRRLLGVIRRLRAPPVVPEA